ncbi:MAG: hypothetical protein LM568_04720 [Desulfurococcaceae archaeon]|nr:hypothetical protein [Desulfurococcaceae archaeon]
MKTIRAPVNTINAIVWAAVKAIPLALLVFPAPRFYPTIILIDIVNPLRIALARFALAIPIMIELNTKNIGHVCLGTAKA